MLAKVAGVARGIKKIIEICKISIFLVSQSSTNSITTKTKVF